MPKAVAIDITGVNLSYGATHVLKNVELAIRPGELDAWHARLDRAGISIEGRMDWPPGGSSLFFRDPDGHLLELATPGLWRNHR